MNSKNLFCNPCSLRFKEKSVLEIHLSVVHNGKNPRIKAKSKLLLVSLAEVKDELFKCTYCCSGFALENHLIEHLRSIHKEEISEKNSHKQKKHQNLRPTNSVDIDSAKISIAKAKPISCDRCESRFLRKEYLARQNVIELLLKKLL